ncbi:MAG: ribonuclease Z [Methanomassiliicoccales archaeon]|nr:ribonuclease Z [Methanomassiliicoccales archaeon]
MIFLGTGGSLPSPKRNVTAVAVQVGSEIVLFDCGEGTQRQFMFSSASFMKVSSVFISHLHGDHFLGLPALVQSMSFNGRERQLRVFGPPGMCATMKSILGLGYFSPSFEIAVRDLKDGDVVVEGDFTVKAVEVEHTVPSLGYVMEGPPKPGRFNLEKAKELGVPSGPLFGSLQEGRTVEIDGRSITPSMVLGAPRRGLKFAISGDTRPSQRFEDAAHCSDVLVHESTVTSDLLVDAKEYGHTTAKQAAELAKRAKVGSLFLYHISSRYEDPQPLLDEARAVFPSTYVAEDLMSIDVVGSVCGDSPEDPSE